MVAAIVVLYNPNLVVLDRLLHSLTGQVSKFYVVDNSPGPDRELATLLNKYESHVFYIPLGDNKGIATAQNIGIRRCMNDGYSHVLLLDQDSMLPTGMVSKLLEAERALLDKGEKVAALGPIFVDEKTGDYPRSIKRMMRTWHTTHTRCMETLILTSWIMASGALIRISVLSAVGLMLDDLFIDAVDTEWGLRARNMGYKSYMVTDVVLRHNTGDASVKVLGREIYLHNETRHYYIVRNSAYLLRLNSMGWRWKLVATIKIPSYVLVYSCYSAHKLKSLMSLSKAVILGLYGRLGRIG